jgi:catechol 2,3-dioxygenase-like lactoylglutathione lyase family enzyme
MKRMHLHVGVEDLATSIRFYTSLFGIDPTVRENDYAKWVMEDPRVNFAISKRGNNKLGVDHLGIQCEDSATLMETAERLADAGRPLVHQEKTVCCYATGQKVWIADPQGVPWETFVTEGASTSFGENFDLELLESSSSRQETPAKCC